MGRVVELITKSFANQCLAFPNRVDQVLATISTVEEAKELLDKGAAMATYAARLRAGIEVERPISFGVLKIKTKLGELLPAKPPSITGAMKGKKGSRSTQPPFSKECIAAYRKMAKNKHKLDDYYEATEDVPTQGDFIRYATGAKVSNNSGENEWYTPTEYIEAARQVMGSIDFDPASTVLANTIVKAEKFCSAADDGLSKKWRGNVWMNPPYAQPLVSQFCEKLVGSFTAGDVKRAIVLVNNATETQWFQTVAEQASAICFPRGRVKFWSPDKVSAPLQGQAVLYLNQSKEVDAFEQFFKEFGFCATVSAVLTGGES